MAPDMPGRNIALMLLGLLALVVIDARSLSAVTMVLLGMTLGPVVGLTSTEPYFTAIFKAGLAGGLLVAAAMALLGWRHRVRLWGQGVVVLGVVAWAICGLIGFGPQ
jgi:hypothetical protein